MATLNYGDLYARSGDTKTISITETPSTGLTFVLKHDTTVIANAATYTKQWDISDDGRQYYWLASNGAKYPVYLTVYDKPEINITSPVYTNLYHDAVVTFSAAFPKNDDIKFLNFEDDSPSKVISAGNNSLRLFLDSNNGSLYKSVGEGNRIAISNQGISPYDIYYWNGMFVITSWGCIDVLISTDLVNFQSVNVTSSDREGVLAFTDSNAYILRADDTISISSNMVSWTSYVTTGVGYADNLATDGLSSFDIQNGIFIASGVGSVNALVKSTNGTTWTNVQDVSQSDEYKVCAGGGKFVIRCSDRTTIYTTNGTELSIYSSPSDYRDSIIYEGGVFILHHWFTRTPIISIDGLNWSSVCYSTENVLGSLNNGTYISCLCARMHVLQDIPYSITLDGYQMYNGNNTTSVDMNTSTLTSGEQIKWASIAPGGTSVTWGTINENYDPVVFLSGRYYIDSNRVRGVEYLRTRLRVVYTE